MTETTNETKPTGAASAVERRVVHRAKRQSKREHPKCPICGKWMLMHPSSPTRWACKDWSGPLDDNPNGEHM